MLSVSLKVFSLQKSDYFMNMSNSKAECQEKLFGHCKWMYCQFHDSTFPLNVSHIITHMSGVVLDLSNLWRADNQGASSQSGYRVCPITRSHDQKIFLTCFCLKRPKKWKLQFSIFKGNPRSKMAATW